MKLRTWIILFIIFVVLIVGMYYALNVALAHKQAQEQVLTPLPVLATTTLSDSGVQATSTMSVVPVPSATSTPGNDWISYPNPALGYQIQYPSDLVISQNGLSLTLTFPKQVYFHWPLQDNASVTVTASSSCPALQIPEDPDIGSSTFMLNGYDFSALEGDSSTSANVSEEIAYDTIQNGICYQLQLSDNGANGADQYVSDLSLIQHYDTQHDADTADIIGIFEAITDSFKAVSVPPGIPENKL